MRQNMPEMKAQQNQEKEDLKDISSGKKVYMALKTAPSSLLQPNIG